MELSSFNAYTVTTMPRPENEPGEVRKRVGRNIKTARVAGGWTADQCAEIVGVSRATWFAWENGSRSPDIDRLDAVAAAVGVTAAEIVK
ncbi:helix-turn-helix domain-containing protein [Thalassoroseus pseudoceratinae]|uniref:helix-turn-helix domain-containing protein n=1 Tax=Thalassoroseus pseudoceratinae TaxID=2713176 RepID=UPI001420BB9E|nr:helix-turn-helix transcriptional regulator [Thalassoroseus pseudoceratinae]